MVADSRTAALEYGTIERELRIEATPDVVYEVLTDPVHLRDWWSTSTDYERAEGATSRFDWTDDQTGRTESAAFTVVTVDPPRRFAFRWIYDEGEVAGPGNSLLVTFDLSADGDATVLRFSESGYRERGWEAAVLEARFAENTQGWDFYLPRLAAAAQRQAAR